MPRYAQVIKDDRVKAAIEVLGTQVKVAILRFLAENGPSTRGEIIGELGIGVATFHRSIHILLDHGAVTSDPPLSEIRSGQNPLYAYQGRRVAELYRMLGEAVHAPQ